ncbi:ubiquitin carboxyl-terminal hydrolase 2-like isoform X2 [Punica granatum]|uniref:Ubiquitin carboxyl-terminal hydrolase n=1 Tax=Punica granatum TaxID=22663 RepID=A0A6P8EE19_PUNGR|nr:ubiquitin carboxyl-terminal hydrolase 2-like isoform X2 [Punica granatum]
MGKKAKKKARTPTKEKRISAPVQKDVPRDSAGPTDVAVSVGDGASLPNEKRPCSHLEKGFDLTALSEKIGSSETIRCEDCRAGATDRRGNNGKGKHGKKKASASVDLKSESRAIWICLECGHYGCGGIGFPTVPQSHAVRHARLMRHQLAIQLENPYLRWCFPCSGPISAEKTEESNECKDLFGEVVKLIKGRSTKSSKADIEDIWFGGGSVTSEVIQKAESAVSGGLERTRSGGYVVRGLVNLGNTCFFNSVMQNLLAMDRLRDHLLTSDSSSIGPLAISLKKLFLEIEGEAGKRNVINPRSLFGSVCSKAPQFRGYQQHDSHELLRCLLDLLSTEEFDMRKRENSLKDNKNLTIVDSIFGGHISSTVCCMECGHTSTVYEPFLDISLPVPTKKPTPKKSQPVSRGKKAKVMPKRGGKPRAKASRDSLSIWANNPQPPFEGLEASGSSSSLDSRVQNSAVVNEKRDIKDDESGGNRPIVEVSADKAAGATEDSCAWLDYLDSSEPLSGDDYLKDKMHLRNPCEDEEPLSRVGDSQVLLLPYKEEDSQVSVVTSSEGQVDTSWVGPAFGPDESAEFDGFGDLFAEPEIVSGPAGDSSLGANSNTVGNSSDSDPGEVDDSDSPVSVESCLAHFTKPELLSRDNAWHCEKCSKALQLQQTNKTKKKKAMGEICDNGSEGKSGINRVIPDRISCNGNASTDLSCSGKLDHSGNYSTKSDDSESSKGESEDEIKTRETEASLSSRTEETLMDKRQEDDSQDNESEVVEKDEEVEKAAPSVKVKRDATKRVLIFKAPPILTVHLKRFSQDARGRFSKLSGHVIFREMIDLRPYIDSRGKGEQKCVYRLVGVVEHLGTMRGGHYVAYIRGSGSVWYHASDALVREVTLEEVLRCDAYILFYELI